MLSPRRDGRDLYCRTAVLLHGDVRRALSLFTETEDTA